MTPRLSNSRRGMTLIELVLSIAIIAVLTGAMGSAILLTARAMDTAGSNVRAAREQQDAALTLARIERDLTVATSITQVTPTSIGFTVPDRGHGTAGPETFVYQWSGVAGAPLTLSYNGGAAGVVLPNVRSFAVAASTGVGVLKASPNVLVLVSNASSPSTADAARRDLVASFGFNVTLFGSLLPTYSALKAAAASQDVLYVGENFNSVLMAGQDLNFSLGIVSEADGLYSTLGFGSSTNSSSSNQINIIDNGHPITSSFPSGNLQLATSGASTYRLIGNNNGLAWGARELGKSSGDPTLITIDLGRTLRGGAAAQGRRVSLPWAGTLLSPTDVTTFGGNARTMLKRSLAWAAAPVVYSSVTLSVQAGAGTAESASVRLMNQPRVPRP